MIPVLVCFPVFGSTPGYVCCVPTHIFLNVLSFVLLLLLLPVLVVNFYPGEINLGFWAMHLFIFGTLLFIIFGTLGIRRFSEIIITVSFVIWLLTYAGFLMFAVYSVWDAQTMARSSINGRCAMNLWLFDWCCKANITSSEISEPSGQRLNTTLQSSLRANKSLLNDIENTNETLLGKHDLSDEFTNNKIKNNLENLTDFFVESKIYATNFTVIATNVGRTHPNEGKMGQKNVYKEKFRSEASETSQDESTRKKRDLLEAKSNEGGPEYRRSVAAFLGTIIIMLIVIGLYTLYAVALNDVLNVLRYPFPLVIVTRIPSTQEQGTSNTGQRTPEIVLK